jgi:hypothetical protein
MVERICLVPLEAAVSSVLFYALQRGGPDGRPPRVAGRMHIPRVGGAG